MRILKKALIFLWQEIEKIIFPPCCVICGKVIQNTICKECEKAIIEKVVLKIEKKNNKEFYFDKHLYVFYYRDNIRSIILNYKFNDKSYLYKLFSEIIIKNQKICGILKKYDIMIPVPIHKNRKKQRGYNQSDLIAKEITKNIYGLEYENNVVEKIKNTKEQSSLKKEDRKQNVQNIYKILNKDKIKNKNIILFDDIYTTGNTVNEISKILKQSGANKILVFTVAKD